MKRFLEIIGIATVVALAGSLLTGCGGGDGGDAPVRATYRVDLENATANQPLSPPAVILHGDGFSGWELGGTVSSGLEELAEGGDPAAFRQEALSAGALDHQAGSGAVAPGGTSSVTVEGSPAGARLTVATMLVNTNDAFTGVSALEIGDLQVGESRTFDLKPLDAGTEVNTELASTIPGPAGAGEGFNAVRDDRGFVSIHPGIVSRDDGLTTSALDESHRFQNPVGRLTVTRLE